MKRLLGVFVAVALAAAALAAWGGAASGKSPEASAPASAAAADQKRKLPPLPREVRQRKRWIVGVKCDAAPFGYIDIRGNNAGFEIEMAQWFARYAFGNKNKVTFVCAPTAVRESLLTGGRVDLVISTFTYTTDRDTRIDFSRAYYKTVGRLLVTNNSSIRNLNDIRGKRIATSNGSIYDRWVRRCFSGTDLLVVDGVSSSILALKQGRADAAMWDDTVLAPFAASDREVKITTDSFLASPYGIGIRQGNTAMKRWVDSRLELMRKKDIFMQLLRNNIAKRFIPAFSRSILRPKNRFGYAPPGSPSVETVCP
jgi:polar amino acid transport system substrate-binding protein